MKECRIDRVKGEDAVIYYPQANDNPFSLILFGSAYLRDHKLIQKAPLSALKDTRLGIDLEVYLRGVLSNPATSEPVVAALGGSPLALISHIENDLRSLERSRIKPVFVLSGLPPSPSPSSNPNPNPSNPSQKNRNQPQQPPPTVPAVAQKYFAEEDWRIHERNKGWESYDKADLESMNQAFARSDSLEILDLVRNVLRALRHRNVEYLVAPYMASGQVSRVGRVGLEAMSAAVEGGKEELESPSFSRWVLFLYDACSLIHRLGSIHAIQRRPLFNQRSDLFLPYLPARLPRTTPQGLRPLHVRQRRSIHVR